MQDDRFEVIGFWEDSIFFRVKGKALMISNKLPKEKLILRLMIDPEDIKAIRDEILMQARTKPLTKEQAYEFLKEITK